MVGTHPSCPVVVARCPGRGSLGRRLWCPWGSSTGLSAARREATPRLPWADLDGACISAILPPNPRCAPEHLRPTTAGDSVAKECGALGVPHARPSGRRPMPRQIWLERLGGAPDEGINGQNRMCRRRRGGRVSELSAVVEDLGLHHAAAKDEASTPAPSAPNLAAVECAWTREGADLDAGVSDPTTASRIDVSTASVYASRHQLSFFPREGEESRRRDWRERCVEV
jgi:hypothetical protein